VGDRTIEVSRKFYDDLYAKLDLYYNVFILTEPMTDQNFWLHLLRLEEAAEAGIVATDKDVRTHLTYLLGGTFDEKRYQQILDYHKMRREDFEEAVRGIVMGEKLIDYFRDTSRSLDSDVIKRYQSRDSAFTVSYIPYPYSEYLEGPELPAPERSEEELERRRSEIQVEIEKLSSLTGINPAQAQTVRELERELETVEKELRMIEAVKAREDAAFAAAKEAAEVFKKAVMDATSAAHADVVDAIMATLPERVAAADAEFRAKLPAGQEMTEQYKQSVESRTAQELKYEALQALRPYYARHFDELAKARNVRVLDFPGYKIDWQELALRQKRARTPGHVPEKEDYEKFFTLNTTISRMIEGQLGGSFPDEASKTYYVLVMRKVTVPEPESIDALNYRVHRKYGEMVRRNQMEALFSFPSVISRHRLQLLESPGSYGGAASAAANAAPPMPADPVERGIDPSEREKK